VGEAAQSGRPAEKRIIPGACGETGVYPKAGSDDKRPIGIPPYEDKILQRAIQLARTGGPMEPIYEQEFAD
jgi:hypothetical protein